MRVNIHEPLDVTDEERFAIAAHYDGPGKRKRLAKRDEIKEYCWQRGAQWRDHLGIGEAPEAEDAAEASDEDLLGLGPAVGSAASEETDSDAEDLLGTGPAAPVADDFSDLL